MRINFRPLLIFVLYLLNIKCVLAQSQKGDSVFKKMTEVFNTDTSDIQSISDLKSLLKVVKTDTTYLYIAEALTLDYAYTYPDTALNYAWAALQVAQKHNLPNHLYTCYAHLGEVFRILGDYPKAINQTMKAIPFAEMLNKKWRFAFIYWQSKEGKGTSFIIVLTC